MSKLEKEIILKCDCSDLGHMVRFTYFGETLADDEFMYVSSGMDAEAGFFYRLKNAFKYLFKIDECSWVFGETVLLPSDIRDLTSFVQEYNDYIERNNLFR